MPEGLKLGGRRLEEHRCLEDVAHGACHWGDWASPHDSDKLGHSDVVDVLLAPVLLLVLGVVVESLFILLHVVDRDCLHLLRVLRRVILPNSVFVIPLSDFVEVEAFQFVQNLQLVVVEVFPVAFCFESRSGERCYFESDVASAFPPFGLGLVRLVGEGGGFGSNLCTRLASL